MCSISASFLVLRDIVLINVFIVFSVLIILCVFNYIAVKFKIIVITMIEGMSKM